MSLEVLEKDLLDLLQQVPTCVFTDYCDQWVEGSSVGEWTQEFEAAMSDLGSALKSVDMTDELVIFQRLNKKSFREIVDEEIDLIISGKIAENIDELKSKFETKLVESQLESIQLSRTLSNQQYQKNLQYTKFHLPMINAAQPPRAYEDISTLSVSVQVYTNINNRQTKLLEISFPVTSTLLDVFTYITDLIPSKRMFDGPQYADSGMILVGNSMYVCYGSEDYSKPYTSWLGSAKHRVEKMENVLLFDLELSEFWKPNYLVFNGDDEFLIFFTTISIVKSNSPSVIYRRRMPRTIKCIACKTRIADLVIVNDPILPLNPAHCCGQCYRRIRSSRDGQFVQPGDNVVVSHFSQI